MTGRVFVSTAYNNGWAMGESFTINPGVPPATPRPRSPPPPPPRTLCSVFQSQTGEGLTQGALWGLSAESPVTKDGENWSHDEAGELVSSLIGAAAKPSIAEMWSERAAEARAAAKL